MSFTWLSADDSATVRVSFTFVFVRLVPSGATGTGLAGLRFSSAWPSSLPPRDCLVSITLKDGLGGLFFFFDFLSSKSCMTVLSSSGVEAGPSPAWLAAGGLGGGLLLFDFSLESCTSVIADSAVSILLPACPTARGLGGGGFPLPLDLSLESWGSECTTGLPALSTAGGLGGGGLFFEFFLVWLLVSSGGELASLAFSAVVNASLPLTPGKLTGLLGFGDFCCSVSASCWETRVFSSSWLSVERAPTLWFSSFGALIGRRGAALILGPLFGLLGGLRSAWGLGESGRDAVITVGTRLGFTAGESTAVSLVFASCMLWVDSFVLGDFRGGLSSWSLFAEDSSPGFTASLFFGGLAATITVGLLLGLGAAVISFGASSVDSLLGVSEEL